MESSKVEQEYAIEDLWELANLAFDIENRTDEKKKCNNTCKHLNLNLNDEGFTVCEDCGSVMSDNLIQSAEWNNYKDESGNYQKNTQRADTYIDNNPYSIGSSGTTVPWNSNSLIGKLHMQQTFTHKQKTYWLISQLIDNISTLVHIPSYVSDTAKKYWQKYMDSGKLTRASVRKGLICACLIHACHVHKISIKRDSILTLFNCSSKSLSKGEKILFAIIEDQQVIINVLDDNVQHFIKYSSQLNLPYSVNHICSEIYTKYNVNLQAVSPKSAVGGIIAYVIKFRLKLKNPTKTNISATVDVCTPTLNKVINLLHFLDKENLN